MLFSERTARDDSGRGVELRSAAWPVPRWRLTGVGRIWPSGPRFSTRTLATAWVRLGEPTVLTLGGWRATMAVVAGEAARLELDIDVGSLRGSSGYKKKSYGFLVRSSSSLIAQFLAGGGESSSRDDVLLALRLWFVGKIRRAWATIYRAFGTYA
jgi:hypothetical protein